MFKFVTMSYNKSKCNTKLEKKYENLYSTTKKSTLTISQSRDNYVIITCSYSLKEDNIIICIQQDDTHMKVIRTKQQSCQLKPQHNTRTREASNLLCNSYHKREK